MVKITDDIIRGIELLRAVLSRSKTLAKILVGIWFQNDVVLTSMRRDDVASTSIPRHFGTKCPLGYYSELQIRGDIDDDSKIFYLISH